MYFERIHCIAQMFISKDTCPAQEIKHKNEQYVLIGFKWPHLPKNSKIGKSDTYFQSH